MKTGMIAKLLKNKGIIKPKARGGEQILFTEASLKGVTFSELSEGQEVSYELRSDNPLRADSVMLKEHETIVARALAAATSRGWKLGSVHDLFGGFGTIQFIRNLGEEEEHQDTAGVEVLFGWAVMPGETDTAKKQAFEKLIEDDTIRYMDKIDRGDRIATKVERWPTDE